jgi:hypothetical protein
MPGRNSCAVSRMLQSIKDRELYSVEEMASDTELLEEAFHEAVRCQQKLAKRRPTGYNAVSLGFTGSSLDENDDAELGRTPDPYNLIPPMPRGGVRKEQAAGEERLSGGIGSSGGSGGLGDPLLLRGSAGSQSSSTQASSVHTRVSIEYGGHMADSSEGYQ